MRRIAAVSFIAALVLAGCSAEAKETNPASTQTQTTGRESTQTTGTETTSGPTETQSESQAPAEVENLGTGEMQGNWVAWPDKKFFSLVMGLNTPDVDLRNSGVTIAMTDEAGSDFVGHSAMDVSNPWMFKSEDLSDFEVHSVDEKLGFIILKAKQLVSKESSTTSEVTKQIFVALDLKTGKEASRLDDKNAIELPYVDTAGKLALGDISSLKLDADGDVRVVEQKGALLGEGKFLWRLKAENGRAKTNAERFPTFTVIPGVLDTRTKANPAFPNTEAVAVSAVDGVVVSKTATKIYATAPDGSLMGTTEMCGSTPSQGSTLSLNHIGDWLIVDTYLAWNPKSGQRVCFDGTNGTKNLPVVGVTGKGNIIVGSETLVLVDPATGKPSDMPFSQPMWEPPVLVHGDYWAWNFEETFGVMTATGIDP